MASIRVKSLINVIHWLALAEIQKLIWGGQNQRGQD